MKTISNALTVISIAMFCGCSIMGNKKPLDFHLNAKNAAGQLTAPSDIIKENGALRNSLSLNYTVNADKLPKVSEELTLTAWVAQNNRGSYQTVAFKGNRKNEPEKIQYCLDLWNGKPEFKYKDKNDNWRGILISGGEFIGGIKIFPIPLKEWRHLAATFNKGKITLYVDGKVIAESGPKGQAKSLVANNFPLLIGAANPGGSNRRAYCFDGLLNDIRVYGKSLSEAEIKGIYNTEKSNYPAGKIKFKKFVDPAMKGYDPQFKKKLRLTEEYEKSIPVDQIKGKKTSGKIKEFKGVPGLFIDGKPVFPMQMMPSPWGSIKETFFPCRDFAAAGIDLYSDIIYTAFGNAGRKDGEENWWLGEGKYDFKKVDNSLMEIVKANPKAMILVRIKLNPPKWWQKKHPDDITVYYKEGKYFSTKVNASLASEEWEKTYERMLRDFIRHVESSDYAGHVYGYSPAGGLASEWYWYGHSNGLVDYSKAAQLRFKKWLKKKYKDDVKALRKSWKDNKITFENAVIPSPQERLKAGASVFMNPETSAKIIDYRNFQTDIVSGNVIKSSRICKEETGFKKTTCVFYGYTMLFEGNPSGTQLANNGFQGLSKVMASPYVDCICSPTDYRERRGGEPGVFISAYNGSYRLHNKLYWDEADIRTHFYNRQVHGRTSNMKETLSVLRRAFGYSLSKGTAMWWFLIVGNAVFHHDDIMEPIAQMKKLGDESMNDDKTPVAQAALIVDQESMNYIRYGGNKMLADFIWRTYVNTAICGAPFDVYLQSDFMNKNMPDYKLYIFANSYLYDKKFSDAVKKKLSKNNAVGVWCYAPGYLSSGKFNKSSMEKITGIKLKLENKKQKIQLNIDNFNNPVTAQCKDVKFSKYSIAPAFWVDDPEALVLGSVNGKASLAVKNMDGWRSVYTLTPLTKELLQGLLDYAGAHVYDRDYNVLYANSSYIMLHSGASGKKKISLPGKYNVTEIFSGKNIGKGISSFSDEMNAPQTKIYRISK